MDKLKVALVGCGQIADAHLGQIKKIDEVELVAVCDREPDLARQAAERFGVPRRYFDFGDMLEREQLDVVHVTTPVATHAPLTIEALRAGVHVYVEKPFTLDAAEAARVLQVARQANRLVCLGHDQLFDPLWLRCRQLCSDGVIGEVRHVESVLGYPIDGPFGRFVSADPDHWVRKLPGGLFQNTLSHPLYRITDFLLDERPLVWAAWFRHDQRFDFATELRAELIGQRVTGTLLFTSAAKPRHRLTRVYGTEGTLDVDLNAQVIRLERDASLPGALGRLEVPWRQWREALANLSRNVVRFCRGELQYFSGMERLFRLFYRAVRDGSEPPVPYDEALRVTRILDQIFASCRENAAKVEAIRRGPQPRLVTDASSDVAACIENSVDENRLDAEQPERSGLSVGGTEPAAV